MTLNRIQVGIILRIYYEKYTELYSVYLTKTYLFPYFFYF